MYQLYVKIIQKKNHSCVCIEWVVFCILMVFFSVYYLGVYMIFGVISFAIYIPCFSVWTTLNVSFIIIAHHFLKSTLLFKFI